MTEAKKSTLTIDRIDPDLKYRFKIWCIEQKTTMRAKLLEWIERNIQEGKKR